jgi:hypothetical protein
MAKWNYELENDVGFNDEGYWEWYEVYDDSGASIAKCNLEANARLIAAVPDLLLAATHALHELHRLQPILCSQDYDFVQETIEELDAAIKKVKGE